MADETNTPVAGVQNATEEQPTKLYTYYYSNPDGASKDERCHAVYTEAPFDVVPWRMHKEAPNTSMTDPVWDSNLNGGLGSWKENSSEAQGQILAETQIKIAQLSQNNQLNTEQSDMLTKVLAKVTEGQENTQKLIMAMQQTLIMSTQKTMMQMTGQDKTTEPANNAEPTNTAESTNK
ncbi:hypothetical protein [Lactobacillus helveticus]|uniref:hypothetical protein n=1 Tax=Lactobacillus helveticus TaxID=1587 RepID=UPI001564D70E|nr:hypothetical protein [Lactobacillus helveticus]NRO92493.1 hypothetical protein [Lactobacillus helveticus]